jgi:DNA-binding beta-propeller fold protein YncE
VDKKLRSIVVAALALAGLLAFSSRLPADTGTCGGVAISLPFTDVGTSPFFCQIAEAFISGLTNGTTPTTYSPADSVSRDQMAAFITRTQDSVLGRGSRRAILKQWATPSALPSTGRTLAGSNLVESDGIDLWSAAGGEVLRVRGADGRVLGTWTGAAGATGVLIARGRVYVTSSNGSLYFLDPSKPPGPMTMLAALGQVLVAITTDGKYLWVTHPGSPPPDPPGGGTVIRVDPDTGGMTSFSAFISPLDILFDGANVWVIDKGDSSLKKLGPGGAILQNVALSGSPGFGVFDGSNIWVPCFDAVTVVRAKDGLVLATLQTNGLSGQNWHAAFDGQRILVTNLDKNRLSLWKAADLTPMGTISTGSDTPLHACSDGINFWCSLLSGQLVRI